MKINSIYEALGHVDDKLVSEAAAVRKKRPMAIIIAACAALVAATAVIAGAAAVNRNSTLYIGGDFAFNMELKKFNITIPEEYMPTDENGYDYTGKVDISVAELFEKFNAPLLITDKFSEIVPEAEGVVPWTYRNHNTGEKYEVRGEPFIEVVPGQVCFQRYYLYSKSLDRNISFYAFYLTEEADSKFGHHDALGYDFPPMEIIKLRDGSSCAVCAGFAEFSYNGVIHRIELGWESTLEMTMQVLEDLEVL